MKINLQLFASTYSTTHEKTEQNTTGGSHYETQGGSHSETHGGSHSTTQGGSSSSTVTNNAAGAVDKVTQQKYDEYKKGYQESQSVQDAKKYLQSIIDKKPGSFQSDYTGELKRLYEQVTGGEKFSYDMNSDVLYQQYKDMYMKNGQKAMKDTLGQAAALTGGYDSSYAQMAAQQTYNDHLGSLNDKVPELYEMAYEKYRDQQSDLYQQFTMASDLYGKEYDQYRDDVEDWQTDREYASGMYQSERDFDYNDFQNMLNFYQTEYWNQKHSVSESETKESHWSKTDESSWSSTDESNWSSTNESNWSHSTGTASSTTNSNGGSGSSGSSGSGSSSGSSGSGGSTARVTTLDEAKKYAAGAGLSVDFLTENEFLTSTAMRQWYSRDKKGYQEYLNYTCGLGV